MIKRKWHIFYDSAEVRRQLEEEYKRLTLSNDFIFSKVMQNEELCRKLIEVILGIKIHKIKYHVAQKFFKNTWRSKGIRLDVYVEDEIETVYDIEMQVGRLGELPRRSRYYQGLIDVENTPRGIEYDKLKRSYVIFICMSDPFEAGRYKYTFENLCLEDKRIRLKDGTTKIFLNAAAFEKAENKDIKSFLMYLKSGEYTDEFTRELDNEVVRVRDAGRWRREYMTFAMKIREASAEAWEAGIEKGMEKEFNRTVSKLTEYYLSMDKNLTKAEAQKKAEQVLK